MQKFVICENKVTKNNTGENSEINCSKNDSANSNEVNLVILVNKKEIKVKTLFDQAINHFINHKSRNKLISTSYDNMWVLTFENETLEKKELPRLYLNPTNVLRNYFVIETSCTGFICFPLKNQNVEFNKNYSQLKNLNLANSEASGEIDLLIGLHYY